MKMQTLPLNNDELAQLIARRHSLDQEFASDCWRWCCQQVITIDEAAEEGQARRRRWPEHLKYVQEMIQILQNERFVIIPKSRRMFATWTVCAFLTWATRYNPDSANFILSETEQKAAFCIDKRCMHIEEHLRHAEFRREVKTLRTKTGLIGRMTYPHNESYLWGLASTGDALRAYTATKVFVDEIEFIEQAPALTRALIPLIEGGAQAIFASSSNGPTGIVAEYCRDVRFHKFEDLCTLKGESVMYAS
jgi:phage FluMu gp28-like protein